MRERCRGVSGASVPGGAGRHAWLAWVLVSLLALAPAAAAASPIVPDRPSVSNGAATVPPGALQVEAGVEYGRTTHGGQRDERRPGLGPFVKLAVAGEPIGRTGRTSAARCWPASPCPGSSAST